MHRANVFVAVLLESPVEVLRCIVEYQALLKQYCHFDPCVAHRPVDFMLLW